MYIVNLFFTYPRIFNYIMHSANEQFTYPCTVNYTMYVQLDELV